MICSNVLKLGVAVAIALISFDLGKAGFFRLTIKTGQIDLVSSEGLCGPESIAVPLPGLSATTLPAAGDSETLKNVQYANDNASDQTLDFYWPSPTERPKATVLFIHGGSLFEKRERRTSAAYCDICKPFTEAGFGCATMDYRLAPTHKWPAMPQDVARAIVVVRRLVAQRGGNADRLFLFGHSSGCHLAAILGAQTLNISVQWG